MSFELYFVLRIVQFCLKPMSVVVSMCPVPFVEKTVE